MNIKTAKKIMARLKKGYSHISDDFDKTRKIPWEEFDIYLDFIKENKTLIDLGCGNGRFYEYIKPRKKLKYIGIDSNKELLKKAKQKYDAKFIEGNLLKIPVADKSIDQIVCIATLHHIPSNRLKIQAIKEMKRILKKNGILIISVWNLFQKKYDKYRKKAFIKHFTSFFRYGKQDFFIPWGNSGVERYYYAFKPEELRKLLNTNGFQILKEKTAKNLLFICKKNHKLPPSTSSKYCK